MIERLPEETGATLQALSALLAASYGETPESRVRDLWRTLAAWARQEHDALCSALRAARATAGAASALGKLGSRANIAKHGLEDLRQRASKGGRATATNREHMRELGKKGGQKLVKMRGLDYMAKIARAGAEKAKEVLPPGFHKAMGQKRAAQARLQRLEQEEQRARELGVKE